MNEAETRAEYVDPKLKASGWGEVEESKIFREFYIAPGKIQVGGGHMKPDFADYVLAHKNQKLAVVEAKRLDAPVGEGVAQAKEYAQKLQLDWAYATNGKEVYEICMKTGKEDLVEKFPAPEELWNRACSDQNEWAKKFSEIPFGGGGGRTPYYYQEIAINRILDAVAEKKQRILLTLATGTGKTLVAAEVVWKLFQARWNLSRDGGRRPRILFLADRNILADQAFNAFSAFPEDALVRIKPLDIRKKGEVPTNGSIFFTIFQTFMSGPDPMSKTADWQNSSTLGVISGSEPRFSPRETPVSLGLPISLMSGANLGNRSPLGERSGFSPGNFSRDVEEPFSTRGHGTPYFGQYEPDFFDFIVVDECHRGGANDESNWRGILEYFSPAVQLGLTATPKRKDNVDTYKYFGEPVYVYSLKEGINDGFLTPFKVKRIKTTLDDYVYTSDDQIVEGEVEEGKIYEESDFNRIIEIKEREAKRVRVLLDEIDQGEKTIVFCATQEHAAAIRELVNQMKDSADPNYCVRVTANDGFRGDQYLAEFKDNEKTIPTILTTSQKLSTGVDASNVRNIVLMRPVNSMIEFKQIIGRGTRLFDGKEYFTIIDFVDAYHHFFDAEWDGEPIDETTDMPKEPKPPKESGTSDGTAPIEDSAEPKKKLKIKLRDGKEREIQHMVSVSFLGVDGKPMSTEEFLQKMYGALPEFFKDEEELRKIWSNPKTRKAFLGKLAETGYGRDDLENLQKIVDAEDSDLFDVLSYVAFAIQPISRQERVNESRQIIFDDLDDRQKDFLEFVLSQYVKSGVDELDEQRLPELLNLKYHALADAETALGDVELIRSGFFSLQEKLYSVR